MYFLSDININKFYGVKGKSGKKRKNVINSLKYQNTAMTGALVGGIGYAALNRQSTMKGITRSAVIGAGALAGIKYYKDKKTNLRKSKNPITRSINRE